MNELEFQSLMEAVKITVKQRLTERTEPPLDRTEENMLDFADAVVELTLLLVKKEGLLK